MASPPTLLTILLLCLATSMAAVAAADSSSTSKLDKGSDIDPSTLENRYTHLHFFMQHNVSGPNPTSQKIVTNPADPSLWTFGVVAAFDDPLTEGLDPYSKLVGRVQGLYFHVSHVGLGLLWASNFLFTEGEYEGSTLAMLASENMLAPVKELPVVGGTGKFRMARGYALMVDHWINLEAGDAILELDVYVEKKKESELCECSRKEDQ